MLGELVAAAAARHLQVAQGSNIDAFSSLTSYVRKVFK